MMRMKLLCSGHSKGMGQEDSLALCKWNEGHHLYEGNEMVDDMYCVLLCCYNRYLRLLPLNRSPGWYWH